MGTDTTRGADRRPVIECVSVLRVFESATGRVQAVRGVDLTIESGRSVAVVGPSGSGKSSLLRMIAALDEPSAGDVLIDGVDLVRVSRRRRRQLRSRLLSHVHQRPLDNLLPHLTSFQQVMHVAVRRDANADDAWQLLVDLGLAERAHHRPDQLSGGEQQRLAFARAAIGAPAVIVADEPTAELDTASTDRVMDAVTGLTERGITLLLATHDQRVLRRVDEVVSLRDGSIASVTAEGSELAVIDHAGRIQLPPEAREAFAERRARVSWDDEHGRLTVERP